MGESDEMENRNEQSTLQMNRKQCDMLLLILLVQEGYIARKAVWMKDLLAC